VPNIPVAASSTVELKPGSFHVMMLGVNKELKVGDTFKLTLKYANGGASTVDAKVQQKN
jgi:periplasmic copper chaperone A